MLPHGTLPFGLDDCRGNGCRQDLRKFIAVDQNVRQVKVVALGANVRACCRIDELAGDTGATFQLTHATLQYVTYAKHPADLASVDGLALVSEARVARDH